MKKQLTREEYQERDTARKADAKAAVDGSIQALLAEVKAGKSERLVEWMNFCSSFHRYSSANQWLLSSQLHARGVEPSFIASYERWQAIGRERHGKPYQVRRGEKALTIWIPRTYSKKGEDEGEEVETHVGFLVKPCVFDASQIDQSEGQPPLDHFWEPQADSESARHLYDVLRSYAADQGFTCHEEALPDSTQGYSQGSRIVVKVGLDSTTAVNTFIHELAHGLMHQRVQTDADGVAPLDKRGRECEAEAVAYIVGKHFGIENIFSSDYLIMYQVTPEVLTARLTCIRNTSHEIIERAEIALSQEVAA
jgi:antirestriction protein ArdC